MWRKLAESGLFSVFVFSVAGGAEENVISDRGRMEDGCHLRRREGKNANMFLSRRKGREAFLGILHSFLTNL